VTVSVFNSIRRNLPSRYGIGIAEENSAPVREVLPRDKGRSRSMGGRDWLGIVKQIIGP
jgi:hypothetical protein